jgi:hypothetical protein
MVFMRPISVTLLRASSTASPFMPLMTPDFPLRLRTHIRDSGILHWLAGLRKREELDTWIGKGASFEGLVVGELIARAQLDLSAPRFSFCRMQAGAEVGYGVTCVPWEHVVTGELMPWG